MVRRALPSRSASSRLTEPGYGLRATGYGAAGSKRSRQASEALPGERPSLPSPISHLPSSIAHRPSPIAHGALVILLLLLIALLLGLPALARESEPEPVALAAMLVRDQHWDRAAAVLEGLDPEEVDELDRFYALRGLIRQNQGEYEAAAEDLRLAIEAGHPEPTLHLHRAQALLGARQPREALVAVEAAGPAGEDMPGGWLLRARAWWDLEDPDASYEAVMEGLSRFPDDSRLRQRQVTTLLQLGLFQEAVEIGRGHLGEPGASALAYLGMAEALRSAGEPHEAALLLEEAHLRFPESHDVLVGLGAAWLEAGRPLAAGEMLQRASATEPELAAEAAECFRQAGKIERALYLNAQVPDATEKARQRLGLLIESQRWDQSLALSDRLERLGLLDEDSVRYALAYAAFMVGDFEKSEEHIQQITDPRVFDSATGLREAMESCLEEPWAC